MYHTGAELGVDEGVGMGVQVGVGDVKEVEEGGAIGSDGLGKGVEERLHNLEKQVRKIFSMMDSIKGTVEELKLKDQIRSAN